MNRHYKVLCLEFTPGNFTKYSVVVRPCSKLPDLQKIGAPKSGFLEAYRHQFVSYNQSVLMMYDEEGSLGQSLPINKLAEAMIKHFDKSVTLNFPVFGPAIIVGVEKNGEHCDVPDEFIRTARTFAAMLNDQVI